MMPVSRQTARRPGPAVIVLMDDRVWSLEGN
jgi:hypothetical protein